MGGPSVWSSVAHPALTPAIEAEMWKSIRNDPPPDTSAVVQFFLYRQSMDPTRFDHYHPRGRGLAGEDRVRVGQSGDYAVDIDVDIHHSYRPGSTDHAPGNFGVIPRCRSGPRAGNHLAHDRDDRIRRLVAPPAQLSWYEPETNELDRVANRRTSLRRDRERSARA